MKTGKVYHCQNGHRVERPIMVIRGNRMMMYCETCRAWMKYVTEAERVFFEQSQKRGANAAVSY